MDNEISKKTLRNTENAKKILQENINILYHLNYKKYKYLDLMLKDTKKELLKILRYLMNVTPKIFKLCYVWYLTNDELTTKIRKRTTKQTSNKHLNYLCALGVIRKRVDGAELRINQEFVLETGKEHMNIITVYKYTDKQLEKIEQRAKKLYENGITQGNISFNKLMANNCENLAHEVYYRNSDKSIHKKDREYSNLLYVIENSINAKGYTTKTSIYNDMSLSKKEIDKLFVIYKNQLGQQYNYKPPNKNETELYHLKSTKWIITRKEKREYGK